MKTLKGSIVLVTGGGSGLGSALCQVLGDAGATVVVTDRRADAARDVAGRLLDGGATAVSQALDVADEQQARQVIDDVIVTFGRLDVLINNAGTDVTLPIDQIMTGDWDRVVKTNLYGPFIMAKLAVPQMKKQGVGQIVNIASTAAKRAWPNASAYHASKWGLLGLSHALHAELRPHNIKVTAVIAGGMRTPFLLERFPDINVSTLQDPANVAQAVLGVLLLPDDTVIPEITVLPLRETSWP